MENPPPVETAVSVRLNAPNDVINGTTEKSPDPAPEVSVSVPVTVIDVLRLVPFSVTETPAKGRDPLISFACNRIVQAVIVASRKKKRRIEARRLMVDTSSRVGYAVRSQTA